MSRIISAFLLGILLTAAGVYLLITEEDLEIRSPAPKILGKSEEVEVENFWFPKSEANKNSDQFNMTARSALVANYDSGEVLFAKNSNERLSAASTIKIMTALVALENSDPGKEFTVSANAAAIGENTMYLSEGERATLEDLLYGMLLVSGNDATITIAEGIAGSEEAFVSLMNEKARKLGLNDTVFVNATGLDEDSKQQYTTAYDLVTLAHYTWEKFPEFRRIVSTYEKFIPQTSTHKEYLLYNDTNLLTSYPGVKGIKPGFTWEAGWCLVTYAENDGKRLLGVILGSEDRRGEMVLLLDYAFGKYGISIDHPGLDL